MVVRSIILAFNKRHLLKLNENFAQVLQNASSGSRFLQEELARMRELHLCTVCLSEPRDALVRYLRSNHIKGNRSRGKIRWRFIHAIEMCHRV